MKETFSDLGRRLSGAAGLIIRWARFYNSFRPSATIF
jgi:hypothetical protein